MLNRKTTIYSFITVLFLVQLCRSDNSFAQVASYSIEHYTTEDGLPSNLAEDIVWDEQNLLWITTMRGIARFDGKWLQPYSAHSGDIIKSDYCGPFTRDKNGKLIFGDARGNIYSFSDNKPILIDSSFRIPNGELNPRVLQLPPAFWPNLLKEWNYLFTPERGTAPIVIDSHRILIGENNVLKTYDRLTNEYTIIKKFSNNLRLFKSSGNSFLYENNTAIYRIDLSGKDIVLLPEHVSFSLKDMAIFWQTGMEESIMVRLNESWSSITKKGELNLKPLCNAIPLNITITGIKYNEKSGVLVITTDGNGLYLCKKNRLTSFIDKSSTVLSNVHSYYSQVEIFPNQLYCSLNNKLDLLTNKFTKQDLIPGFSSVAKIKDSIILFYQNGKIFSWSYRDKVIKKRCNAYSAQECSFAFTENRLFEVGDSAIIELSPSVDSIFKIITFPSHHNATDILEYRPGYLVFCGYSGIYGLNIHTKVIDTLFSSGKETMFRGITAYNGYLILARYGAGLFVYKDGKIRAMPLDNHRYLFNAHNTYIDKSGFIWISTNSGVFRTKAKALTGYFNDSTSYVNYEFFGKEDGFDIAELNGGNQGAVTVLKNGNLAYTGINGIVTVDLQDTSSNQAVPSIFADKIVVNDSIVYTDVANIPILSSKTKRIRISLLIPIWGNLKNEVIEYNLDGYSDKWEQLNYNKQNFIELINIPDGDYTVRVRISSIFDKSVINEYSFQFKIAPPWYKTMWFLVLAIITGILIIWGISSWRNFYLRNKNKMLAAKIDEQVQEIHLQKDQLEEQILQMEKYQAKLEKDYALKNRLISMIGHDMITPLRFMSNAGKQLIEHKDRISAETYEDIVRTMVETGNNLKDMSTNMLNWIRHHSDNAKLLPESLDLYDIVQHVTDNVTPMSKFKQIVILNHTTADITLNQYKEPLKNILLQLLSNAIKYCNKCDIIITSKQDSDYVTVSIADEGPGMTKEQIQHLTNAEMSGTHTNTYQNKGHGFGYLIIKDMLAIIDGSIAIDSKQHHGTTVHITFPSQIQTI